MRRGYFITIVALASICSPALGAWIADGTLPAPICAHGVGLTDEGILVLGGFSNGMQMDDTYVYHPGGGFTPKAPTPLPVHDMAFVTHGGRIYSIGGYSENQGVWDRIREVWSYDPNTDTWDRYGEPWLNFERDSAGASSLDGFLYVVGGHHEYTGNGVSLSRVDRYSPGDPAGWQGCDPLHYDARISSHGERLGRAHASVVAMDGKVYAIGGQAYEVGHHSSSWGGWVEVFDPAVGIWATLPPMPTPRSGCAVAVVGHRIYTIGGDDGSSDYTSTVEYFDTVTQQWSADEAFPILVASARAVSIDNRIYVLGGQTTNGAALNTVYVRQLSARGDLNCDGSVDFRDINPLVLALSNPWGYWEQYPLCDIMNADMNCDGAPGFGDINPFVACLSSGDCDCP